jgi:hypothetical protein
MSKDETVNTTMVSPVGIKVEAISIYRTTY